MGDQDLRRTLPDGDVRTEGAGLNEVEVVDSQFFDVVQLFDVQYRMSHCD